MPKKPSNSRKKTKGFTLTEVLITIVIVGILSAVALPNYFRQVQRTRQSEAASTLSQLS
ncbi:MAG: type IV pilin protein, partial [Prochlorococcus sp.]